jgi:hypothetical protein
MRRAARSGALYDGRKFVDEVRILTRAGITRVADAVLADMARGRHLGMYHELIARASVACRQLAAAPEAYSDQQLAHFVTYAAQGAALRGQESPQARVAGHLLDAMGELAAEALMHRMPAGGRPC